MRRLIFAAALLAATPALAGRKPFTSDDRERIEARQAEEAAKPKRQGKDIIQTAEAQGDLKTFLMLAGEAGIIDTLTGPGPITVFAPTDGAFKRVPKRNLDALRADKEKLKTVLLSHVVVGQMTTEDLSKLPANVKLRTASTDEVAVSTKGKKVKIDKATIVKPDIAANNGLLQVVDTMTVPAPAKRARKTKK